MNEPIKRRFSMWRDDTYDIYEIVLWDGKQPHVVQTNIRTHEKAQEALATWRKRDAEQQGVQP